MEIQPLDADTYFGKVLRDANPPTQIPFHRASPFHRSATPLCQVTQASSTSVAWTWSVDRIRKDRILHEALTAGPDPLHLSLVFGVSRNTAARYATVAKHLLSDELEQSPEQ